MQMSSGRARQAEPQGFQLPAAAVQVASFKTLTLCGMSGLSSGMLSTDRTAIIAKKTIKARIKVTTRTFVF